jgi:beta-lactamase regulating signal transducer with metallopeptidase domain
MGQAAPSLSDPDTERAIPWNDLLDWVWGAGAALLLAAALGSELRFSIRLRRSRERLDSTEDGLTVYGCPWLKTPCLAGLIHPAVYLPSSLKEDPGALRHALAHEESHLRQGDLLWARLRCLALALHWYNPLVWLAAVFSKQDGELACDEGAVRRLGEAERAAYGKTLLRMSCPGRPALMQTATTMTGGARALRERIVFLARKPKPALLALVISLLIAAAAAGCAFVGAKAPSPLVTEAVNRSDYAAELDPLGFAVTDYSMDSIQAADAWARAYAARIAEGLSPDSPFRCRGAEAVVCVPVAESLLSPR